MNKPLCVVSAPPDTYSGYGARARDFIKALIKEKGEEWEIKIMSQRWGALPFGYLSDHEQEWGWMKKYMLAGNQLPKQPDYWFQITIPTEFQPVGKWNCGVTAGIETNICHPSWIEGCNRMNLVLVSSNHAKNVFVNSRAEIRNKQDQTTGVIELKVPVEVLFEGVDLNKYYSIEDADLPATELIEDLDSIEEDFCYLFVGHWLPGSINEDRKNVGYMVKAFLETFKNRKNKPALILKTAMSGASIVDRDVILSRLSEIQNVVQGDLPRIYLLYGDLPEEEINYLYNHPKVKAMLNFTKGEGFGRPLLEFTQVKKPIIASGWSGHTDFLDPKFTFLLSGSLTKVHPSAVVENTIIAEASWFAPDPLQTNQMMLELYENYDKYLDLAKRQAYKAKKEFSFDAMSELLNKFLNDKAPKFQALVLPKMPTLNIPKLTKATSNDK